MIEINGNRVVLSEQVLLAKDQTEVTFRGEGGLVVSVSFSSDADGSAGIAPRFESGTFHLPLSNFGSALGMAVSGRIQIKRSASDVRPGAWALRYSLSVHLVEAYRLLNLTISDERVA